MHNWACLKFNGFLKKIQQISKKQDDLSSVNKAGYFFLVI